MNFCPECGTKFGSEARFCQECGFDINSVIALNELTPKPIIQTPVVVTTKAAESETDFISETSEPSNFSSHKLTQPIKPGEPITRQKRSLHSLWIVLALVILVGAGWFGYKFYIHPENETPLNKGENTITPESTSDEKAGSNTKDMSLMDQELAKQKEKEKQQSDKPNINSKPNHKTAQTTEIDIVPKVILEVGHKEEPKNKNPRNPIKLTLQKPTMIVRITTDHYNDGMGTPRGGKITIKDQTDKVIGSYKALGKTGKNGTPSAKWVAEPNIMLEKGTYFISDSDPFTWSKTFLGSNGFVVVEGYEVE